MGADIHMYVEYASKKPGYFEETQGKRYWRPFGGRTNPGRDYWLFTLLADVRGSGALIEPRGMPDDAGWYAADDNQLYITETEGDDYVTMEEAQRYVSYGSKFINGHDGKPVWVTNPDWHSHSWLTVDELQQVFDAYNKKHGELVGLEYRAMLDAMRTLENGGNNDVRVVFWFDN